MLPASGGHETEGDTISAWYRHFNLLHHRKYGYDVRYLEAQVPILLT
jgi:hypothetical protein